jgi:O-antigen/teichoic acid export membrane protein
MSWIPNLFMLGYGPTLIARIAAFDSANDRAKLRQTLWSAMLPTVLTFCLIGIVASSYFVTTDLTRCFPEFPTLNSPGVQRILIGLIWFQLVGTVLTVLEFVQCGFQENHLLSIRALAGNLLTVGFLVGILPLRPDLSTFVIVAHGPAILSRLVNVIIFFARRPFMLPARGCVHLADSRQLFMEGVVYSSVTGVAAYLCHRLPILLVASYGSVDATSRVAAILDVIIQLFAVVALIAFPFVPALSNSIAVGDAPWSRRAMSKIVMVLSLYGLACFVGLTWWGPWFFGTFLGGNLDPSRWMLASAGAYMAVLGLENFYFLVLCSMHRQGLAAALFLARAAMTAAANWLVISWGSDRGIFLSSALSVTLITLGPYFEITRRAFLNHPPDRGNGHSHRT